MAPYTSNLHIANIQVDDQIKNGHHPALSHLKTEDSWCDIKSALDHIDGKRVERVLYEHRSDIISKDELKSCYKWVQDILEG